MKKLGPIKIFLLILAITLVVTCSFPLIHVGMNQDDDSIPQLSLGLGSEQGVIFVDSSTSLKPQIISQKMSDEKINVNKHKITLEEITLLKEKTGISKNNLFEKKKVAGHGTGLLAPTEEEWGKIGETTYVIDEINYSSSDSFVDHSTSSWFPPIGDQDGEGSCTAWAVGYYVKTFQEAKEHNWDLSEATWEGGTYGAPAISYQNRIISPDFIYHLINDGTDEGSSYNRAIDVVCSIGASSWETMPNDPFDYTTWPSKEAWIESAFNRGEEGSKQIIITNLDSGIENLKTWLSAGNLALIAIDANQFYYLSDLDFWTLDTYSDFPVNHANTIVGYDDDVSYIENGEVRQGAFKVANSWGIGGWENVNDGFYWISYEVMKQRIGSCLTFNDLIDYEPELTSTFQFDHDKRGELEIAIGLGTPSSPVATKSFTEDILGGDVPFSANEIVFDITELKDYVPTIFNQTYFIEIYDGLSSTVGTLQKFCIENYSSVDVPVQTVNNQIVYSTVATIDRLVVSPSSGMGGVEVEISGWAYPPLQNVNITYYDSALETWTLLETVISDASGNITFSTQIPDLKRSQPSGDNPEAYVVLDYRSEINEVIYGYSEYNQYLRGMKTVGDQVASGLYGNETNFCSTVQVNPGDSLTLSGKWFAPGVVNIRWDNQSVMETATSIEWSAAEIIGTTEANQETGSFDTAVTIPTADSGEHYLSIEDSQTRLIIKVSVKPSAYIFIEHTNQSDLVVDIGVENISGTLWSQRIWDEEGESIADLELTVDLSAAQSFLPPSEEFKWFLRVFDSTSGNQGQISEFTINSSGTFYTSMDTPKLIHDFEESFVYIPSDPELHFDTVMTWFWEDNTTINVVETGEVDSDGLSETITGGFYFDGLREVAQLVVWDSSSMTVDRLTTWYWTGNTRINSLAVGNLDEDEAQEIVTGGYYFDGERRVAQIVIWDGETLAVEGIRTWYWTGDTEISSLKVADVDGDGTVEIVTGGYYFDGVRDVAQLVIWDPTSFAVENITGWYWTDNTRINSIDVKNMDADNQLEIITGGYHTEANKIAQLVIWDGLTLEVENLRTWYWTNDTEINSVTAANVDEDPSVEVVTGGYFNDNTRDIAQLVVWSSDLQTVEGLNSWYWNSDTKINTICVEDVDLNGDEEIITGGFYNDLNRDVAQLIIWDGDTMAVDYLTDWYWTNDTSICSVSASNIDGDAALEIITGGYYNDNTRNCAQVTSWEIY